MIRPRRGTLFCAVIAATVALLTVQLFIPPIVGLADQGDFRRTIGRFGYGPEQPAGDLIYAFVAPKYVPDASFHLPEWEQFTSEYLFIAAALLLNKVVSTDGKLDIVVVGFVHTLAFLAIFVRLLLVTRNLRARAFVWIAALVMFPDAGYVAYWNSFYAEPASCLFFLLLLTESIAMCDCGSVSRAGLVRWSLSAVLLVLAKPQNAPLGLPLALFSLCLRTRVIGWPARSAVFISAGVILAAAAITILTTPSELKNANTYNLVFLAILPESRNPSVDLKALGLDPRLRDYSRTGAWSPNTIYPALEASGAVGKVVTLRTVVRFYLLRPARLWRHIQALLPVALSLRPECCGNFEPSAGYPPGARSSAWTLWSGFHERVLSRLAKFILFLLPIPALIAALMRNRNARHGLWIDFSALLAACSLIAFLTAAFGDAWENIRHLFLFNLFLDACLLASAAFACSFLARRLGPQNVPRLARERWLGR